MEDADTSPVEKGVEADVHPEYMRADTLVRKMYDTLASVSCICVTQVHFLLVFKEVQR